MSKRILGGVAWMMLTLTPCANAGAHGPQDQEQHSPHRGQAIAAPVSKLLSTLSRIPDDFKSLRVQIDRESKVEIKGITRDVPALLTALSGSKVLEQLSLASQVPYRYASGYQEFTVTAQSPPTPSKSYGRARLPADTELADDVLEQRINGFVAKSKLRCERLSTHTILDSREPGAIVGVLAISRCDGTYADLIEPMRSLEQDPLELHIHELQMYPMSTIDQSPRLFIRFTLAGFRADP